MEIDFDALLKNQLQELNVIVDRLEIPSAAFKAHGASAFASLLYDSSDPRDIQKLKPYTDSFEQLCASAPKVPIECLRALSMAYATISLFWDGNTRSDPPQSQINLLMMVATIKGIVLTLMPNSPQLKSVVEIKVQEMLSKRGSDGARVMLEKNEKQKAKIFVKTCWSDWQIDNRRYVNKTDFARDMLDKQPILKNQKVITDWCRLWEKQSAS